MTTRPIDSFFSDPKEKELALRVWDKGSFRDYAGETGFPVTAAFLALEKNKDMRALVLAADWISNARGEGEPDRIRAINEEFGKPDGYFSTECCANVEHVYRAASMSFILTPAGGALSQAGYELLVDPFLKEPLARAKRQYERNNGIDALTAVWNQLMPWTIVSHLPESFKRNGSQLLFVDMKGWLAASYYWESALSDQKAISPDAPAFDAEGQLKKLKLGIAAIKESLDAKGTKPPAPPPAAPANPADYMQDYPVTRAGIMLSKVSMERYQTYKLWPLIWITNLDKIGDNPNKVPMGINLKIKKKEKYTPDDLAYANKTWNKWQVFN
jgi:hypothetical protein